MYYLQKNKHLDIFVPIQSSLFELKWKFDKLVWVDIVYLYNIVYAIDL